MLAHSPPLPLVIDHLDRYDDINTEDEEGIILALQHRDRVRCIRLVKPISVLQGIINSLDGEFPNLEYLFIVHQRWQRSLTEQKYELYKFEPSRTISSTQSTPPRVEEL